MASDELSGGRRRGGGNHRGCRGDPHGTEPSSSDRGRPAGGSGRVREFDRRPSGVARASAVANATISTYEHSASLVPPHPTRPPSGCGSPRRTWRVSARSPDTWRTRACGLVGDEYECALTIEGDSELVPAHARPGGRMVGAGRTLGLDRARALDHETPSPTVGILVLNPRCASERRVVGHVREWRDRDNPSRRPRLEVNVPLGS